MPRFVYLPIPARVTIAPPGPPGGKSDVTVAFAGASPEGRFAFVLPAYDLATHHQLEAIHVGLYSVGTPAPADPASIVAAPHHYSAGCAALTSGGTVAVDAGSAPAGDYDALAVLEFDA